MIANAQLDNERASQTYQIQLWKDKLDEMEETHAILQREYKNKCRDHDALKRANVKLTEDLKLIQGQLNERDTLIAEQGLTIATVENEDGTDAKRVLVSAENAQLLDSVQGSLGKFKFYPNLALKTLFVDFGFYLHRCSIKKIHRRKTGIKTRD